MSHGRFKNPVEATLAGVKDFFRKQALSDHLTEADRADGKTVLVTGANSGLGFAIAVEMARRGGRVIMACRSGIPEAGEQVRALSGSDQVEMMKIDLSDLRSIYQFCDEVKSRGLVFDIVVSNAGVATPYARQTPQGLDEIFMVNYLAPFILMNRLLRDGSIPNRAFGPAGQEKRGIPRILFISSDSHQGASAIDWEEFGTFFEYGVKKGIANYSYYKLVLNTFATELSRRLNSNGQTDVSVNVMCPGPVNTNIVRDAPPLLKAVLKSIFWLFFQAPEKAALPVAYLTCSAELEGRTNYYQHMFNPKEMDPKVYDAAEGKKLWEESEKVWERIGGV